MKLCIDTDKIPNNLTLQDTLVLISVGAGKPIKGEEFNKLVSLNYITNYGEITLLGERVLSIINTESNNITKDNLEELATSLRDIFPAGKKPGTNYMWRDSKLVIVERLRSFFSKFNIICNNEEVIDATKRYVESFDGDYRYMQLLKYFIMKREATEDGTELKSQLLSYIENKDEAESSDEWLNRLV